MVKKYKPNKIQIFLDKYRKPVLIYTIVIWSVFLVMILTYNSRTSEYVSRDYMKEQVEEKCSNNITLPEEEAYSVIFNYDAILNITNCEVKTK